MIRKRLQIKLTSWNEMPIALDVVDKKDES